jgi:hypothetical protein
MAPKGKLEKKGASKDSKEKGKTVTEEAVTLESFVSQMLPLIDLEKEAEIAASLDSLATLKPEVAERRGALLLNLKCSDVQVCITSHCDEISDQFILAEPLCKYLLGTSQRGSAKIKVLRVKGSKSLEHMTPRISNIC